MWSVTLFVTLLGIALGYYFSHRLIVKNPEPGKQILTIFLINTLILVVLPFITDTFLNKSVEMSFTPGIFLSVVVLFLPSFFLFGVISPLLIHLISNLKVNSSKMPSLIFSISTFGGVFGVYFFGFYIIPYKGVWASFYIIDGLNLLCTLLILFYNLKLRPAETK